MKKGTLYTLRRNFILTALLPAIIFLALITIVPFALNIVSSFKDYYLASSTPPTFVGGENYRVLFRDTMFWRCLRTTFYFTSLTVTAQFWLGFGFACLINERFKGQTIVRIFLLIPFMCTSIVIGFLWRMMYNPSLGIINYFLRLFHLPKVPWADNPMWALLSLVIVDVWQWTPFMMLILLAGLASLPKEPFEAAKVDGANALQIFTRITLPLIKPVAVIAILLRTIDSFKTFDIIFVITKGGPGISTQTLNLYTFLKGFTDLRMGMASAMAILFLVTVIGICLLIVKVL